jgi:hypothetical protein
MSRSTLRYALIGLFGGMICAAALTYAQVDQAVNSRIYTVLDSLGLLDPTAPPPVEPPPVEPPPVEPPPPPPPPPSGTVLYQNDFEGSDPFAGWLGRNVGSNLRVISESGNKVGRLIYDPHSDWICSFPGSHGQRRQGVMKLVAEFSVRLPQGFRYKRDANGDVIGGGKHFWQLTSMNRYRDGAQVLEEDGRTRMDFGQRTDYGTWDCTAYRNLVGGGRPGEFATVFAREDYFLPLGSWHRVKVKLVLNEQRGQDGQLDLWIDEDHKGTFRGEFNVVGATGGITAFGFGNLDNVEGAPWVDIDGMRITAQ